MVTIVVRSRGHAQRNVTWVTRDQRHLAIEVKTSQRQVAIMWKVFDRSSLKLVSRGQIIITVSSPTS